VVLGATAAGCIFHGFEPGVARADFERSLQAGEPPACMLRSFHPAPGECFFVPGGTVHAIGAGVTLIEVQENSDTTFRVDDWGRVGLDGQPRELHIDEAFACFDFGSSPAPVPAPEVCSEPLELACCEAFSMGLVDVTGSRQDTTSNNRHGAPRVLAAVRGSGSIDSAAGRFPLHLGDVVLLPAALGDFQIHSHSGAPLRLIDMRGPRPA